ncbi:MAG: FAD-binding protein, partial [Proteobacteria bacterium]
MIDPPRLRLATESATSRALLALERELGPSRATGDRATRERFASDESPVQPRVPDIVVFAETAGHVETTLRIAEAHGVPVTPRAGGTSRVGGAVPLAGGIVLCTAALSRIVDLDRRNSIVVVEPGVVLGALHRQVEAEGLFYPPDPSSWESCMIGGNVAANAGGPRALKYGNTRDYVLGLQAHLMGGRTLRTGRRTAKGVVGYDVTSLLVGSEGTLAVFSEITLKLLPDPPSIATVLAVYTDVAAATRGVISVCGAGILPRCAELM